MNEETSSLSYAPLQDAFERISLADALPLQNPISIQVDPTSLCNFRCSFCPTGDPKLIKASKRVQNFMDIEIYERILSDIGNFTRPLNVLRLYKDGEPLLHPEFVKMVALAKKLENIKRVETTTNGSKLTRDKIDQVLNAGIDRIVISIEGVTENKYLQFAKVKIDFALFVDNLTYLFNRRGKCKVHIKTVSQNLGEGEKDIFMNTFGPISDRIFIENIVESWPGFEIDQKDNASLKENAIGNKVDRKRICPYLFYTLSINSDGTVSPCCVDWNRKLIIGNIKHQTIQEIWLGEDLQALRQKHIKSGRKSVEQCSGCGQLDYCVSENLDDSTESLAKFFC
jgi:radical SAM protein with 4Fe4S-binding SPASM domain